jgi:hypothetical protein
MFNKIKATRERACSDTPVFPANELSVAAGRRADGEVAAHVLTRNRTLNTEHVSAVLVQGYDHMWEKTYHTCVSLATSPQ